MFRKAEFNQSLSLLESLEQIIKIPLQDKPFEEVIREYEPISNSYNGAKEYFGRLRTEAKDQQGKENTQLPAQFEHLLGILNTFIEKSLIELLDKWESIMTTGRQNQASADLVNSLLYIILLGLEVLLVVIALLQTGLLKKQKVSEELAKVKSAFKKLNEIILSRPSLTLLGEYQLIGEDLEQITDSSRLLFTIEKIYKEMWKFVILLKKLNQLPELCESLMNILEIALIELIDCSETSQNLLGCEIAMTIFGWTDDDYLVSLINIVSSWNKKAPLNNLGKLYQIIFLYANINTRIKILEEVEQLEPQEVLHFMELFDVKMYEGFIEGSYLFQEESQVQHKPAFLLEKLNLAPQHVAKLQDIMNNKICDELSLANSQLKMNEMDQVLRKRWIDLMKVASIGAGNPLFFVEDFGKIQATLSQIIEESFENMNHDNTHPIQIQVILDLLAKDINAGYFEHLIETASKSSNKVCQLFSAKFGNILQHVNGDNPSPKMLFDKVGDLYHRMLETGDSLARFKAIEGIMLAVSTSTLEEHEIGTIVPPKEEDKELLRKVADPQENGKKIPPSLNGETIQIIGGRFPGVQKENINSVEKFKKLEKEFAFNIESLDCNKDEELEKAFQTIKNSILKVQNSDGRTPLNEYRELELKNKVNALQEMFNRSMGF